MSAATWHEAVNRAARAFEHEAGLDYTKLDAEDLRVLVRAHLREDTRVPYSREFDRAMDEAFEQAESLFRFESLPTVAQWRTILPDVEAHWDDPTAWQDHTVSTLASLALQHTQGQRDTLPEDDDGIMALAELRRRLEERYGVLVASLALDIHEREAQWAREEHGGRPGTFTSGKDAEEEAAEAYTHKVQAELAHLRVRRDAQELLRREESAARRADLPPAEPVSLEAAMAEGVPETQWRIEGLLKADSTCVLSGPYKAGKSLLVSELVRSLADGEPYLDHFPVNAHEGRVMVVDTEQGMSELLEVLAARNIRNKDRVELVDTSGIVADWDLTVAENMDRAVAMLQERNVSALVFDPLAPLFIAMDVDENTAAAQKPLEAFNELKRRAGLDVVILSHHSGHGEGGRARGNSAISGWPAVLWDLVRKGDGFDADRLLTAKGRGVGVAPGRLVLGDDQRLRFVPEADEVEARRLAERTIKDDAHRSWVLERVEADPGHSLRHYVGMWESGTVYKVPVGERVRPVKIVKNSVESAIRELQAEGWLKDVGTASRPALEVVPEDARPPRLHNPAKAR